MAQSTITVRLDEHDKNAFDHFCSEIGLNTSATITLFIKTVLRENRIPFEITLKPEQSREAVMATDQLLALSEQLMHQNHLAYKELAKK